MVGDRRRRHHDAFAPAPRQIAFDAIAARRRLMAEARLYSVAAKLARQPIRSRRGSSWQLPRAAYATKLANMAGLPTPVIGNRIWLTILVSARVYNESRLLGPFGVALGLRCQHQRAQRCDVVGKDLWAHDRDYRITSIPCISSTCG